MGLALEVVLRVKILSKDVVLWRESQGSLDGEFSNLGTNELGWMWWNEV